MEANAWIISFSPRYVFFLGFLFVFACAKQPKPVSDGLAFASLSIARTELGEPYFHGGRGPELFDCSGLITYAYKSAVGENEIFLVNGQLEADATIFSLFKENVRQVNISELRLGDLVFITDDSLTITHGGLFAGWVDTTTLQIVHASEYFGEVVNDSWPISGEKRGQWLVGAGQLLTR